MTKTEDNGIIILKKHPGGPTRWERTWKRKKQRFVRLVFHDEDWVIRYYGLLNLDTMVNGNPPGFIAHGKSEHPERYNFDMTKKVSDATNGIHYFYYTISLPNPDEPQMAQNPDEPDKGKLSRRYYDTGTFMDDMSDQEAYHILSGGIRQKLISKLLIVNIFMGIITIVIVIIGILMAQN